MVFAYTTIYTTGLLLASALVWILIIAIGRKIYIKHRQAQDKRAHQEYKQNCIKPPIIDTHW